MGQPTFTITPWKVSPIRSSWPWPWSAINLAFNIRPTAIPPKLSFIHPQIRKPARTASAATSSRVSAVPARDRVVDFGKYKGRMLGSLPSTYLKWVSKNLRAGDMEEWARLADEALDDPVYRDRIEWEAAEKILSGDAASYCSNGNERNAVTELLEISERFGWDNEDKSGWSRIDFGLLGTSRGGRIPRVAANRNNAEVGNLKERRRAPVGEDGGGRRRERRERVRRLREKTGSVSGGWATGKGREEEGERSLSPAGEAARSPFPGREALLKKVLNRERL